MKIGYNSRIVLECPDCEGIGRYEGEEDRFDPGSWLGHYTASTGWHECPTCKGDGFLRCSFCNDVAVAEVDNERYCADCFADTEFPEVDTDSVDDSTFTAFEHQRLAKVG